MFYYIEGNVSIIEQSIAVIDVGGVGYLCNASLYTISRLELGKKARLYTYCNIREDAFDIFGFYDLSFDIGKPADVFSEEETEYIARAVKILKDNGKSIGMATGNTDKEFLKGFAKLGINCFTSGSDFDYLRVGAVENLKNLKNGIK